MVLKKLQMFGFKSFAEKSEVTFGQGMTAIVGPNGCGKSNVVDAIRWVFGEQKASALRSNSMQDVIFSGTQKRQPLNFAEVTLIIDNNRGVLPTEYSEVAITRRVYRSGESEYRLNKVPCRLRDINNLFLDTGVGSNAYTTIENNMINSILSDKAEERRILFEEAAGIGKYKQRRKESERKLEYTKMDLARINDKVRDREQDVRMLARQVEKAQKYRKWYDELKALEIGYEARHYSELDAAMAARKTELDTLDMSLETIKARIAADDSRIEGMNIHTTEKEVEVQSAAQKVAEVGETIVALDKDILLSSETLKHLSDNIRRYEDESRALESQIEEKSMLRTSIEKGMVEAETLLQRHQEDLVSAQEELRRFDASLSDKKAGTDHLSQERIRLINAVGDQRNIVGTLESALRHTLDARERAEKEIALLTTRYEEYSERIEECAAQLKTVSEQYQNLLGSRETLVSRIDKEDERYRELLAREKHLEAQIDSSQSQLEFLKGLDAQFEGYGSGVKALLTGNLPGRVGIAADLIKVADERMTGIVDRVLGTEIQTVVFRSDADLRGAVEYLHTHEAGTARLVSLERLERSASSGPAETVDGMTPLRQSIAVDGEFQNLANHLFDGIFVAPSLDSAMTAAVSARRGMVFVTEDGVVCHPSGTVIAGGVKQGAKSGILMRKKLIDSLPGQIDALRREFHTVVHDKEICIITRDEAKLALAEVNEKLSSGQRKQQEQETHIKHYQNELDTVHEKLSDANTQLEQSNARIGELEGSISAGHTELEKLQVRGRELEQQVEESKIVVVTMEKNRVALAQRLTDAQLRIQGDTHKVAQNKNDIASLTKDVVYLEDRKNQLIADREKTLSHIAELQTRAVTLVEELTVQKGLRDEEQSRLAVVREEYNKILNDVEEIRKQAKVDRQELDGLSARTYDLRNDQTRAEEKMRGIRERIFEMYHVDLASPPEGITLPGIDDSEAEETIRTYKERVNRLTGQVNMAAPEEYETKNNELIELVKQRDDLQNAVDDLEKAIKRLNKEAREKFIETFDQVKKNFTEIFTTLFEGGEVHLSLEENVDPLEAAININVRPAGKKMRGVQLLSGGERALTAISLLFSLYKVKPSAYCILDELDAPLDDANIGRFVRIVRDFSTTTQFIIITHNKRTMEASDVLYGVTHQEAGVSSIVSVMLDNALAFAA